MWLRRNALKVDKKVPARDGSEGGEEERRREKGKKQHYQSHTGRASTHTRTHADRGSACCRQAYSIASGIVDRPQQEARRRRKRTKCLSFCVRVGRRTELSLRRCGRVLDLSHEPGAGSSGAIRTIDMTNLSGSYAALAS